jgi:hypothetical protein
MLPLRRHRAPSPVDSPALSSQQRPAYLRFIGEGRKLDESMTTSTLRPGALPRALSERLKQEPWGSKSHWGRVGARARSRQSAKEGSASDPCPPTLGQLVVFMLDRLRLGSFSRQF